MAGCMVTFRFHCCSTLCDTLSGLSTIDDDPRQGGHRRGGTNSAVRTKEKRKNHRVGIEATLALGEVVSVLGLYECEEMSVRKTSPQSIVTHPLRRRRARSTTQVVVVRLGRGLP